MSQTWIFVLVLESYVDFSEVMDTLQFFPHGFQVVRWGNSVYANIQKFIQFQLTVNVAALVINFFSVVSSGDVP